MLAACATVTRPAFDEIRHGTLRGITEAPITLHDGAWVGPPSAPGAASALHVVLWSEPVAFGELDGQPGDEAVVLVGATTGGSASFVYVAAFARRDGRLTEATATLVGDRVKVLALGVADRRVTLDILEAGPGDALCCPSRFARKTFGLQGSTLVPASPVARGSASLADLAGTEWTLVSLGDRPLPPGAHVRAARDPGARPAVSQRPVAGRRHARRASTRRGRYKLEPGHRRAAVSPEGPMANGREHWTNKGGVKLFLWEKSAGPSPSPLGTILFVHGSSMASTPTFDLQVPGRPDSSAMDHFVKLGYDTWCVDMEGYGRSDKSRPINADIATGADDLEAATEYIQRTRGIESFLVYGISSGALRAALFAQRRPARVRRLALDAFVWTGEGSPTLAERRKRLPEFQAKNRRPMDHAFVRSIFTRDHPGTADEATVEAFAKAIIALDDSVPTGTYVDMCAHLPIVDPARITVPTIVMRGQYDGIASFDDLVAFFTRLPNPDKQFAVMPGIAHASFQQKNYQIPYHILHAFFSQPAPIYRGA